MNLAIYVCLEYFHDAIVPPSVKTYPFVDFKSLMLDIQLISLCFSKIIR